MLNPELEPTHRVRWLGEWRARARAFFLPNERTRPASTATPRRTRLELRVLAAFRLSVLACVALAVILVSKSWLFPPRNLALGKPVTCSSKAWGTTPQGAVDGNRYGQLGFHSDGDPSPWLAIDLGAEVSLSELKIFGRAECCYDQSVPLAIEVSSDGSKFEQIAERSKPFTQYEPWVFRPNSPTSARFVRLRTLRQSVLVTSEVEVYGREL